MTDLAQGGVTMKSMPGGTADNLGAQVATQFEANRELFGKTKSLRLEIKAAALQNDAGLVGAVYYFRENQ